MSTWAGLTANLLLKERTLLCPVEEWEAVSNISSVSQLCLFCVSKGMWVQLSVKEHIRGKGRSNWHRLFWENAENKRKREGGVTVFWRSTDLTVRSVVFSCSIGVQNQNERPENEDNSSPFKKNWDIKGRFTSKSSKQIKLVPERERISVWLSAAFEHWRRLRMKSDEEPACFLFNG